MKEIDLLSSLPKTKRRIDERSAEKDSNVVRIARSFGPEYFDGERKYGYGGYSYDGRWRSVARDLIEEYKLTPGMRVLDIGCAKGFLVKDLMIECPGLEVFGVDISDYALLNCEKEVIGRLHKGSASSLPFPANSFDLVISINTIHNLDRQGVIMALREIERIKIGNSYIVVDSYRDDREKRIFENWVLTARYHDFPEGWISAFQEAGFSGDYSWTIIS